MADPSSITSGIAGALGGWVPQILFWAKWSIILLVIMVSMVLFYFFMQYRYKVIIFVKGGSGSAERVTAISKILSFERAKPIKNRSGIITDWQLLISRKKIPPIDLDNVYPGNKVFLFKSSEDHYTPIKFTANENSHFFTPISNDVRKWQNLEIQQAAQDYNTKDFWTQYFPYIVTIGSVACCCLFAGVVLYFSFDRVDTLMPALQNVATNLNNVNYIPGAPN